MTRVPYRSTTPGTITGDAYMDRAADILKDLLDASAFPLTSVAGTANAVTATLTPDFDADGLVDGMKFTLTWAQTNTGAVTLKINSASALPVLDASGAALVAGAITAGLRSIVEFVGGNFRILGGSSGGGAVAESHYQAFTASGTWNKPAGLDPDRMVVVEAWGGGGGGGRGAATGAGGGGGGAYVRRQFRAGDLPSSVAVTVGAGGAGRTGSNGNGAQGGTTTFGALLSAGGGGGGGGGLTNSAGGGGGGELSAGGNASGTTAGTAGSPGGGGLPYTTDSTNGHRGDARTIWGGGAGATAATSAGPTTPAAGWAVFGGGGGGAATSSGPNVNGGQSLAAGAGGAGSGSSGAAAGAGQAPSGGGGGGWNTNGADGARGECRVWIT